MTNSITVESNRAVFSSENHNSSQNKIKKVENLEKCEVEGAELAPVKLVAGLSKYRTNIKIFNNSPKCAENMYFYVQNGKNRKKV